jgi:hypothetical protein
MGSGSSIANAAEIQSLYTLVDQIRSSRSIPAIQELERISGNSKYKEALCAYEELGLLSTLKTVLEQSQTNEPCCSWIFVCLCNLTSDSVANRLLICSKELALVPILMRHTRGCNNSVTLSNLENIIYTSSLTEGVHEYLLSSEVDWLSYIVQKLKQNPNDLMSYWVFNNFISRMRNDHLSRVINFNVPELVLQKMLSFGSNPSNWSASDKSGIIYRIYIFVANFSSIASGRIYLKEYFNQDSRYSSHFIQLLDVPDVIGILSTIILANVYGRDENNNTTKSLLNEHKEILPRLIDLLDITLNYDDNRPVVKDYLSKGFTYGPIKLHVLTSSIRNLSVSDENKNIMIKYSKLIELGCQEVQSFISSAKEFSGIPPGYSFANFTGGGGKDFLTLENTMELLLQLSFVSDDEKILNFTFTNPHFKVKELMERIIDLSADRKLPYEIRQFALQFLARLQPKKMEEVKTISETVERMDDKKSTTAGDQEKTDPISIMPKHIMLSYSWSANKHLVIAVGKMLREKGYDVWRDEEGSTIMSPMSGDIVETMGGAVDKSYAVIIFVSPEYKESTNCRQEAGYARARATNSGVKLIYVMMNESYHTRSSPRQVDGWLGFMIGSELWYPLFNENFVESTVSALIGLIGDNAKQRSNYVNSAGSSTFPVLRTDKVPASSTKSDLGASTTFSFSAAPAALSADADFNTAYNILNQPKKTHCPNAWNVFLKDLCVEEPDDLRNFETRKLLALAEFLKPIPSVEFLKALKL